MQRIYLIILFILTYSAIIGQDFYSYQLQFDETTGIVQGSLKIELDSQNPYPDTLLLHLPSRSLEANTSMLQEQLLSFQDLSVHFESEEKRGFIRIINLKTESQDSIAVCTNCEFTPIVLSSNSENDQVNIEFSIKLPSVNNRLEMGLIDGVWRITDWLPRLAPRKNKQFYPIPINLFRDQLIQTDSIEVSLELNSELDAISNLKEIDVFKNEIEKTKTIQWLSSAANLHIFIAQEIIRYPLNEKVELAFFEMDPWTLSTAADMFKDIDQYLLRKLNYQLKKHTVLILPKKKAYYQSKDLISLEISNNQLQFESEWLQAILETEFRIKEGFNGYEKPYLSVGIPYFYKYNFIDEEFKEARWIPYSTSVLGRVFSLDDFQYSYQNQFLYLYLARQGLDQEYKAPSDSLTKLNYEAIPKAKSFLGYNHLNKYVGDRDFNRAMKDYMSDAQDTLVEEERLEYFLNYYSNKEIEWFTREYMLRQARFDYNIISEDHCPTVATLTVKNNSNFAPPYSVSHYKDGKLVFTEWIEGHTGTKSVQLYLSDADKYVINAHQSQPELNQKNNSIKTKGALKKLEPLHLQFYSSFDDPDKTQIFWQPSLGFNAYDKILLGVNLYNTGLTNKKWEYSIAPTFSTGTSELTGSASLSYTLLPKSGPFRQIKFGAYARYLHYDRDLSFFRLSPAVNFYFQKPYGNSPIRRKIRARVVSVERELAPDFDGVPNSISNASYTIANLTYFRENIEVLNPSTLELDIQAGNAFSRASISFDKRWMLPNKRWFIWRSFAGAFFNSSFEQTSGDPNFYSFGLSGTQDYTFDQSFIGRSDTSGIWSKQFFTTDGGFRSATRVFADSYMISTGFSLPIWTVFGVYGDIGVANNFDQIYYGYGIRVALVTDFLEFYMPMGDQNGLLVNQDNYGQNLRFVLDLNLSHIINRLRRAYY